MSSALTVLRLVAGPLALAGFFLPWAEGPGALASVDFSGYSLVGFTGRLGALELGPAGAASLLAVRLLLLGAGVASLVHALLAAWFTWHTAYRVSGWWIACSAPLALLVAFALSGDAIVRPGTALLAVGAGAFLLAEWCEWALRAREPRADLVQQLR